MSGNSKTILVTRPTLLSQKDAAFFQEKGFQTLIAPMLEIGAIPFSMPDLTQYQGLIFTSASAVRIFCEVSEDREMPVYCVGQQTSQYALKQGFLNVHAADGDVLSLVDMIAADKELQSCHFLYLRSLYISNDLAALLEKKGIRCASCEIYDAQMTDAFPPEVLQSIQGRQVDAIGFMSARSAENFVHLVRAQKLENCLKDTKALCLSDSVLECVRILDWASTHVSPSADGDVFREFCVSVLNNE